MLPPTVTNPDAMNSLRSMRRSLRAAVLLLPGLVGCGAEEAAPGPRVLDVEGFGFKAGRCDMAFRLKLEGKPLQSFTQQIPGTDVKFEMIAIPGGSFCLGSPDDEPGRGDDEGPQRSVSVDSFWIGKHEVRWDEYDIWSQERDAGDPRVDGVARPTPPYTDMTFGMGREGFPAVCMTQHAAATYCEWLSRKTGRKYRLPTEAEWEWACRAGSREAYSCNADELAEHAWFLDNSERRYHEVGTKKPNAWGIHDMHGNVAEWTCEQYVADRYAQPLDATSDRPPLIPITKEYPIAVRGGSFLDGAQALRSAARRASHRDWKQRDPQIPKSIWYMTDAQFVGFRVVCIPE